MLSKFLNKSSSLVFGCSLKQSQKFQYLNTNTHLFLRNISSTCAMSQSNTLVVNKMSNEAKIVRVFDNIIKSSNDSRVYRGLELENGMKCLLISDSKTDRSAASVDVHIGALVDPIPGLAHFCEHMLFLGSEKYPKENTFAKFIEEHAGSTNAYTGGENTNYHFEISNEKLKDALDIFSQFFIKPSFDVDSTDREINAVNSENQKNLQIDGWRLYQFEKSLSKPTHPYSKFSTGNAETLKTVPEANGLNIRDELIKFHGQYYSANLMNLVILSPDTLDTMQAYVEEMFTSVPNKNLDKVNFDQNPFDESTCGQMYSIVPVQESHSLILTFELPDHRDQYEANPSHYLSHLVGHEGPGSLLSELKARGWANGIYAGGKSGARGFSFFNITVDLSEEGVENVNEIMKLCFQYLNLLRGEGVHTWVLDELSNLGKIKFEYKDKEKPINYVTSLSGDLHTFKMEHALCGAYYLTKYEPELIKQILDLLTPEKMKVFVVSNKFEGKTDKKEKWYDTDYRQDTIDAALLDDLKNCGTNSVFKLPPRNEFIPENLSLIKNGQVGKHPYIIKKNNLMRLWYREDDKFLLPKASVRIELRNPLTTQDPKYSNITSMFIDLLTDSLNEYSYAADLSGLRYSFDKTNYGIQLSLNGFDNKLDILLEKIVERMVDFKIDEKRYNVLKEQYVRDLHNFQTQQPYSHAAYFMTLLLVEKGWTKEDLVNSLNDFTLNDVQEFIPRLLTDGIFIDSIFFGNITKERALSMMDKLESQLSKIRTPRALLPQQLNNYRHLMLPDKSEQVFIKENKIHKTIGIETYYQCREASTRNNVLTELFCQIINEATYNVLRTQEQLGYIVASGVRRFNGMQGVRFILQSDRQPDVLDEKIEAFVESIKEMLNTMSDEQFKCHVHALELVKLEEPKKISKQCDIFWNEISSHQYHFDRETVEVEELKKISKDDVIEFYQTLIHSSAESRKKLVVFVNPPELTEEMKGKVKDKLIQDISEFKAGLALCPLPKAQSFSNNSN